MKLNELFKPEQTASLQNFKDYYDNATQSMITRVKAGEHYHEVINQLPTVQVTIAARVPRVCH